MLVEADDVLRRARERVGKTLRGKWTIDALLGVGGMAAVYSATHPGGGRVAVKWLHPELVLDKTTRRRFVREGYIANRIQHPGVVRIIEDGESEDGSPLLFMELLEGETLEARWRRSGKRLELAEVLRLGHALLDVLVAAHEAGVVHRDLKPENLFVTRDGELKVLDFGIARMRELSTRSGVTGSQSSLGTPAFMPPEQARGRWQEVDARTDLWAVGATMFTLLTGRHVHEAETVNEQLLAAMTEPAPALADVVPSVPADVAVLVDHALAYKSDQRWPDARAMRTACALALASVMGHPPADGENPAASEREAPVSIRGQERDREVAHVVTMSGPTLTTGRPVASVLPEPAEPAISRLGRRRAAYFAGAAAAITAIAAVVVLRSFVAGAGAQAGGVDGSSSPAPAAVAPPAEPVASASPPAAIPSDPSPSAGSTGPRSPATHPSVTASARAVPPRPAHPTAAGSAAAVRPAAAPRGEKPPSAPSVRTPAPSGTNNYLEQRK